MSRPHKDKGSAGFYDRGELHWYRFTFNGKRYSFSTETKIGKDGRVTVEALQIAERKREEIEKEIVKAAEVTWEKSIENYISKKSRSGEFRASTKETARYAFKAFNETFPEIQNPQEVTQEMIEEFYYELKDNELSEATARNYVSRVSIFLRQEGLNIEAVKFKGNVKRRTKVIDPAYSSTLIGKCTNREVLFILHAGFNAGMRKNEIVMARPEWFHLLGNNQSYIQIPEYDEVSGFRPKNKKEREIPIIPAFEEFLKIWNKEEDWKNRKYAIAPNAHGKKYRYDFRKPFSDYLKSVIFADENDKPMCFNFGPHTMRHSYISTLASNPKVTPAQLSAWSGDKFKTLENHYIHIAPKEPLIKEVFLGTV